MLFLILLEIVGIIVAGIIFATTQSTIGFIICGIFLALIITIKIFAWLVEEHPVVLEFLYLVASVICASISVGIGSAWPIIICVISIGFLKGGYTMTDADTSWYDTHFFTIDGKLYSAFNSADSDFICLLGVILFMILYFLLSLPYVIFKTAFLAYIPGLFFLIRLARGIIANR